jgi:NH3-dependent NAD+ synthetase
MINALTRTSSIADINPIGGISKTDLKKFIGWAKDKFDLPILGRYVGIGSRKLITSKLLSAS